MLSPKVSMLIVLAIIEPVKVRSAWGFRERVRESPPRSMATAASPRPSGRSPPFSSGRPPDPSPPSSSLKSGAGSGMVGLG